MSFQTPGGHYLERLCQPRCLGTRAGGGVTGQQCPWARSSSAGYWLLPGTDVETEAQPRGVWSRICTRLSPALASSLPTRALSRVPVPSPDGPAAEAQPGPFPWEPVAGGPPAQGRVPLVSVTPPGDAATEDYL